MRHTARYPRVPEGELVIGIGKFGPYIRYKSKFYSLKKGEDDPYSITPERAIEVILEKADSDKKKIIKDFGDIMLLNGRYGPYISFKKENYKIPKGKDPKALTLEECRTIIAETQPSKSKSKKKK